MNIAIITARGGSKRIPQKNIKYFCGKPILEYSILAALNSEEFDEVMVSTDDETIATIAKKCGANVPFLRSEKTAGDFSTTSDVLIEVINQYKSIGKVYDYGCCIYPTAPFVTAEKLKYAMNLLEKVHADTVMPVVKFSFPPQRCVIIEDDKLKMKWAQYLNARSQDLEPFYHDCGQYYGFNVSKFLQNGKLLSDNTIPIITPELEVQDIDSIEDWEIAEIKYKMLQKMMK